MKVPETLTPSARRRITSDWLGMFPEMGEYKPLHLLRRVGPLLEGIVLERTTGNDLYRPTFHVHCLLRKSPVVTMTLAQRLRAEGSGGPDSIPVLHHEKRYMEAARTLARQSPLALSGDLSLARVIEAYRDFAARPGVHYDADTLYEDMALLCAWCGDGRRASGVIADGLATLGEWPGEIINQIGGRQAWHDRISDAVADRGRLLSIVDEQVRALGLESIPTSAMSVA